MNPKPTQINANLIRNKQNKSQSYPNLTHSTNRTWPKPCVGSGSGKIDLSNLMQDSNRNSLYFFYCAEFKIYVIHVKNFCNIWEQFDNNFCNAKKPEVFRGWSICLTAFWMIQRSRYHFFFLFTSFEFSWHYTLSHALSFLAVIHFLQHLYFFYAWNGRKNSLA